MLDHIGRDVTHLSVLSIEGVSCVDRIVDQVVVDRVVVTHPQLQTGVRSLGAIDHLRLIVGVGGSYVQTVELIDPQCIVVIGYGVGFHQSLDILATCRGQLNTRRGCRRRSDLELEQRLGIDVTLSIEIDVEDRILGNEGFVDLVSVELLRSHRIALVVRNRVGEHHRVEDRVKTETRGIGHLRGQNLTDERAAAQTERIVAQLTHIGEATADDSRLNRVTLSHICREVVKGIDLDGHTLILRDQVAAKCIVDFGAGSQRHHRGNENHYGRKCSAQAHFIPIHHRISDSCPNTQSLFCLDTQAPSCRLQPDSRLPRHRA